MRYNEKLPPFPFLVIGNSGAVIRAEKFTDDQSLKKDGDGTPQTIGTVVLPGLDAPIGTELTFYAGSLITNYGAILQGGETIPSYYTGKFGGDGPIDAVSAKSTDGIKPDAISHKQ